MLKTLDLKIFLELFLSLLLDVIRLDKVLRELSGDVWVIKSALRDINAHLLARSQRLLRISKSLDDLFCLFRKLNVETSVDVLCPILELISQFFVELIIDALPPNS